MEREFIRQKIGTIAQCNPNDAQMFAQLFHPMNLEERTLMPIEELGSRSILYLQSGLLYLQSGEPNKEITQGIYHTNDFLLLQPSHILHKRSPWHLRALIPSRFYIADQAKVEALLTHRPQLMSIYFAMHQQIYAHFQNRIQLLQSQTATQRYHHLRQQLGRHLLHIPYQIQASYLSISRKQLSRILKAY
jgi:CRP-like cAMP-binding protein